MLSFDTIGEEFQCAICQVEADNHD
jgi:hypothetical protein